MFSLTFENVTKYTGCGIVLGVSGFQDLFLHCFYQHVGFQNNDNYGSSFKTEHIAMYCGRY